ASSSNARSVAMFSIRPSATAGVSSGPMPRSMAHPSPISPTISSSTRTRAQDTRWQTARILGAPAPARLGGYDSFGDEDDYDEGVEDDGEVDDAAGFALLPSDVDGVGVLPLSDPDLAPSPSWAPSDFPS